MTNRLRMRQRFYQRKALIVTGIFVTCLTIGLTIFFNLSRIDNSAAATRQILIVDEQQFTVDKNLDAPVIRKTTATTGPVQLARRVKEDNSSQPNSK